MRYWLGCESAEVGPLGQEQVRGLLCGSQGAGLLVRSEDQAQPRPAEDWLAEWTDEPLEGPWPLVLCVVTEVARRVGWSLVPMDSAAIGLTEAGHLLVLLPRMSLTAEQAKAEMERWYTRLKAGEWPGVRTLSLIVCLPSPSAELEPLRKQRKAAFLSSQTLKFDYLAPNARLGSLAALDKEASAAVEAGVHRFQAGDLAGTGELMEQLVTPHHQEMYARIGSVRPNGTYAILAICLLMFAWTSLAGGSENLLTLLRFGANFAPLTVDSSEWWRLFGCTFLHIGLVHLACNMLTLLSVGTRAEQIFGTSRYLALYALAGLCGSLASALTGESVSAGASGALFGVCGAVAILGQRYRAQWPPAFRRGMFSGMLPMLGYNLLYGFSNSGIDNAAHLGGMIFGALFALLVRPLALDGVRRGYDKALLAVGLLPFLVQLWVVQSALSRDSLQDYPQQVYRDPSGDLEVTAPAFFRLKTEGQESFFQGPGMVFLLVKLDDPQAVKISNPWFLELLQNTEGTGSVKTETLAGRSWALRDAVSGEVSIRQGFAYLGTMPVKVEVGVPRAEGKLGDQLRLLLIQNLRRKDYDRLNQGKALAKLGLHARALEELAGVEPTLEVQIQQVASLVALARYDEADKLLKQLETEHPQDLAVQTQRWWLADRSKDYQRALAACRKVSELEKDAHKKIHHKVGEAALLAKLGRHQEAASLYAQARASDDAHIDSDIWNSQAWVLVLSGRFREALPLAEKAIQKGKSAANLDTRGRALLELGRWQEAKADFEEILNENVNEPYANYAVGRIMQQEGDKEQARLFYFRYLALAGENAEFADDARQRANEMAGIKAPPER